MWTCYPLIIDLLIFAYMCFVLLSVYHTERNHQGVGKRLLKPLAMVSPTHKPIRCRERIGGHAQFLLSRGGLKMRVLFSAPYGLETGLRYTLHGHEGGNFGSRQGFT